LLFVYAPPWISSRTHIRFLIKRMVIQTRFDRKYYLSFSVSKNQSSVHTMKVPTTIAPGFMDKRMDEEIREQKEIFFKTKERERKDRKLVHSYFGYTSHKTIHWQTSQSISSHTNYPIRRKIPVDKSKTIQNAFGVKLPKTLVKDEVAEPKKDTILEKITGLAPLNVRQSKYPFCLPSRSQEPEKFWRIPSHLRKTRWGTPVSPDDEQAQRIEATWSCATITEDIPEVLPDPKEVELLCTEFTGKRILGHELTEDTRLNTPSWDYAPDFENTELQEFESVLPEKYVQIAIGRNK
jgi:hypothetical protein